MLGASAPFSRHHQVEHCRHRSPDDGIGYLSAQVIDVVRRGRHGGDDGGVGDRRAVVAEDAAPQHRRQEQGQVRPQRRRQCRCENCKAPAMPRLFCRHVIHLKVVVIHNTTL